MTSNLTTATLAPYLRDCGYRGRQLRRDFAFGSGQCAPLVGFAHEPADARSACIAVVDAGHDSAGAVGALRQLGAPVVLACAGDELQWWQQCGSRPKQLQSCHVSALPRFFRENASDLSPEVVYRAKTWGCLNPEFQLGFVDVGLMPLVDKEIGEDLTNLIRRMVSALQSSLGMRQITAQDGAWLLRSSFWLLAAKILRDKKVPAFVSLDLCDVRSVFARMAAHYGTATSIPIPTGRHEQALSSAAESANRFAGLSHVTTESLAYVYENALISKATRSQWGTHSTPSYLVDYIVWQLAPWVRELPVSARHVFEPACGHAGFLVSSLRMLKQLLPRETRSWSNRRTYLRGRLHGIDNDPFALELAQLSLTLADIPNPNGWDLKTGDMFDGDLLEREAGRAGVLLSNPPFERFQATEVLRRTLPHLKPGAVFGVVVPQGFLHAKEASDVRSEIANHFEIAEICLFPDKVFTFSDSESAVLLGRRVEGVARPAGATRYRRIREEGMDAFKTTFAATIDNSVPQQRFTEADDTSMRVPDLEEIWAWCAQSPRLSSIANVVKGLTYESKKNLPPDAITISDHRFPGAVRGFARWYRPQEIHELPRPVWMGLNPEVIQTARAGATTGCPQVLLNYARVSRGPWRLKALIDSAGHAVTSRFLTVRPISDDYPLEFLWALCNSPFSQAFVYTHTMQRDILTGLMREMPVPRVAMDDVMRVTETAQRYLALFGPPDAVLKSEVDKATARDTLVRVDAEVLRLYGLPPRLERQLLDVFAGHERLGVPFTFDRYFPADYEPCFSLHDYLSQDYQRSTAGALRERYHPIQSSELRSALAEAVEHFGE